MDITQYEKRCELFQTKPSTRIPYKGVDIYISTGQGVQNHEDGKVYNKVMWAIGADSKMVGAQELFFEVMDGSSEEARINTGIKEAKEFIDKVNRSKLIREVPGHA